MLIDIFFASAHFLYHNSIFQSSFLVLRLLLFICKRTSVLGVRYLFTKDYGPSLPVLYTKAAVLITRFVYKGPRSLSFAIHLQRTVVLVFWLFIFKGLLSLSSAIYLQRIVVLVLCYSFAKDCSPCLVVYICKGLLSLSCAICLQRTVVLVLSQKFAKYCGPCLVPLVCKETAVLIFRFYPSKLRWTVVLAKTWGTIPPPPGLVKTAVS